MLEKFLNQEFPGGGDLRKQLAGVEVRGIDSDGSLELRPDPSAPRADVVRGIPIEAEVEDLDGVKIHILLHVLDGVMRELEVYREDPGRVQRGLDADELSLIIL